MSLLNTLFAPGAPVEKYVKKRFYDGRWRPSHTCRANVVYQQRYTHLLTDYVTDQNLARMQNKAAKRMAASLRAAHGN